MEKSVNLKIPASLAADLAAWGRQTAKLFEELAKHQTQSGETEFPFPIPQFKRPKRIPKGEEWFWSDAWQAGEREVNEALAHGEYLEFNNVEDAIQALHQQV